LRGFAVTRLRGFRWRGLRLRLFLRLILRFFLRFRLRFFNRFGFGRRCGGFAFGGDAGDDGIDGDGVAFLRENLSQRAGGGRGDLGVDFVGGDLEQRLIALDLVADFLQPARHGSFGDRFAHLGHDDISGHSSFLAMPFTA